MDTHTHTHMHTHTAHTTLVIYLACVLEIEIVLCYMSVYSSVLSASISARVIVFRVVPMWCMWTSWVCMCVVFVNINNVVC